MTRMLALVGRDLSSEEVAQLKVQLLVQLTAWLGGSAAGSVEIVDSQDWYKQRFARCGSLDSWVQETVTGKDYGTREPLFHGYIACEEAMERANTEIVKLALRNQRPVLRWLGSSGERGGEQFQLLTEVSHGT